MHPYDACTWADKFQGPSDSIVPSTRYVAVHIHSMPVELNKHTRPPNITLKYRVRRNVPSAFSIWKNPTAPGPRARGNPFSERDDHYGSDAVPTPKMYVDPLDRWPHALTTSVPPVLS